MRDEKELGLLRQAPTERRQTPLVRFVERRIHFVQKTEGRGIQTEKRTDERRRGKRLLAPRELGEACVLLSGRPRRYLDAGLENIVAAQNELRFAPAEELRKGLLKGPGDGFEGRADAHPRFGVDLADGGFQRFGGFFEVFHRPPRRFVLFFGLAQPRERRVIHFAQALLLASELLEPHLERGDASGIPFSQTRHDAFIESRLAKTLGELFIENKLRLPVGLPATDRFGKRQQFSAKSSFLFAQAREFAKRRLFSAPRFVGLAANFPQGGAADLERLGEPLAFILKEGPGLFGPITFALHVGFHAFKAHPRGGQRLAALPGFERHQFGAVVERLLFASGVLERRAGPFRLSARLVPALRPLRSERFEFAKLCVVFFPVLSKCRLFFSPELFAPLELFEALDRLALSFEKTLDRPFALFESFLGLAQLTLQISQNSSEKAVLTAQIDDKEVEYTVFYDPYYPNNPDNRNDCNINVDFPKTNKIDEKNYYGKDFIDKVNITINDDNGIKGYSINIIGPEEFKKNTGLIDISEGNDIEEEVRDEEDNITEKITYKTPYKETSYTV